MKTLALFLALLKLPLTFTPSNTNVRFEVDSTWHLIHGEVHEVKGGIDTSSDGAIVRVDLPVKGFDTGNGHRDERMREVLAADRFENVRFLGRELVGECPSLPASDHCRLQLNGEITIRDVTHPITLQLTGVKKQGDFSFHGETSLRWRDFGVEDPSILVAKLDEVVRIFIDVDIPLAQ